ncbi:MAG: proton-conducting transporter membrane subunit [Daejeonella sp.]
MQLLLQLFILVPLAGFLISLFLPSKKEAIISGLAIGISAVHLLGVLIFIALWLAQGAPTLDIKHITLFQSPDIEIFIDLYFDSVTAVFAAVGSLLTFLVITFSKYYLHREEGFKRFFSTILSFFLGYNVVIFSGNFETLFIGWEILGIASFLLIAFYRDRYLPVRNALKVISVYRLGDICLILAMWMSHHLWHENITFLQLNQPGHVAAQLQDHSSYGIFIGLMILIAAAAKSAQLPFSSWLPRAMEGPTSSSAIFYGSLSVHLGVFLLLRTQAYWADQDLIKWLIISIGLITCFIASSIASVQSSVKTQIAYSSVAQIGLIFIEVAFGLHTLALIHFAGNAFLRTYQLLVSPSVLSYLIHDMFFTFTPKKGGIDSPFVTKIKNSFYILAIKEWNLDGSLYSLLWKPFKTLGSGLKFLTRKAIVMSLFVLFLLGIYCKFNQNGIPSGIFQYLPLIFSFIALMLILRSFSERGDAIQAWLLAISGQLFMTLSINLLNESFGFGQVMIYLSGVIISSVVGYICMKNVKAIDHDIRLDSYHGYNYEQPKTSFIFLLASLGLIGLPFTPTFIGIDLMFSHIDTNEIILIIFTSLSFLFVELAILRIYSRVFLGQHKKNYHPIAFKYS